MLEFFVSNLKEKGRILQSWWCSKRYDSNGLYTDREKQRDCSPTIADRIDRVRQQQLEGVAS